MNKLRSLPAEATGPIVEEQVDDLAVTAYATRAETGHAAALDVAARLRRLLAEQALVRVAFAAAPSQNELLDGLAAAEDVDWSRVHAFQLDEYVGVPAGTPGLFRRYLAARILDRVRPGRTELIDAGADPEAERSRYAEAIAEAPLDVALLGIGENGHLAFNDPPLARFDDPLPVRVVSLTRQSRLQQVADGCFASVDEVPERAITLTIPTLVGARCVFCVVPGGRKRAAVARALRGEVDESCPASILRRHRDARLYLDSDSYPDELPR